MTSPPLTHKQALQIGWQCKCPRCKTGDLYPSRFSLVLMNTCANCGLALDKNDSADGPAVFLIFVLGFLLVPLALMVEYYAAPPLWLQILLWSAITLILTLGTLRPIKAYVIALQYKYRQTDWDN